MFIAYSSLPFAQQVGVKETFALKFIFDCWRQVVEASVRYDDVCLPGGSHEEQERSLLQVPHSPAKICIVHTVQGITILFACILGI